MTTIDNFLEYLMVGQTAYRFNGYELFAGSEVLNICLSSGSFGLINVGRGD